MNQKIIEAIKNGQVGVIPTDTIYGLIGSALLPRAVEKIYQLRQREATKPFIILISSTADLKDFNIRVDSEDQKLLQKIWPNPISVVLPCADKKFAYLHRGKESLAFRIPAQAKLRQLIAKTGPIVAPSANLAGQTPAETITQAKGYFGDHLAFYCSGGTISAPPSTLVSFKNSHLTVLREGAIKTSALLRLIGDNHCSDDISNNAGNKTGQGGDCHPG